MRRIWSHTAFTGVAGALLLAALAIRPAVAAVEPLEVPRGPGLGAEDVAGLPPLERVERAADSLHERGYRQFPVLAWALLQGPPQHDPQQLVGRAVSLAPEVPAVRFEAARLLRSPGELAQALVALVRSFPAVVWIATVGGAALGVGALLAASMAILIGLTRTLALHGHALGHLTAPQDPPAWPGVLMALGGLAVLPLVGLGPAVVLAAAGALAALRTPKRGAVSLAVAVAAIGLVLGPGADYWARFAALQANDAAGLVVWRVDRGQPLPGDRELLEWAVAREPDDLLLRLGLAGLAKREGRIARAKEVLDYVPDAGSASLHAHAENLSGILHLADGEVDDAIAAFEDARAIEATAPVLYNLSQAYARGMRLIERTAPFSAARSLDSELVSRYTSFEGKNVHRFLIHAPLPLSAYLLWALEPSGSAAEIAREVRIWTLGPRAPAWAWLGFPLLGVLAVVLRRSGITRCSRCERPLCRRCVPNGVKGTTCVRCARLFARNARSDPRIRKRQMELDRRRQRRLARVRAGLALVIPGAARVFDGQLASGGLALLLAGTGAALLVVPRALPIPFEVGELGGAIPLVSGWLLLAPAYLWGLRDSRKHLAAGGARP